MTETMCKNVPLHDRKFKTTVLGPGTGFQSPPLTFFRVCFPRLPWYLGFPNLVIDLLYEIWERDLGFLSLSHGPFLSAISKPGVKCFTCYVVVYFSRPQSLSVCGQRLPSAQCSGRNQKPKTKVSVRSCACVQVVQMRSERNRCK